MVHDRMINHCHFLSCCRLDTTSQYSTPLKLEVGILENRSNMYTDSSS